MMAVMRACEMRIWKEVMRLRVLWKMFSKGVSWTMLYQREFRSLQILRGVCYYQEHSYTFSILSIE
jgi:hypothetical protein